MDSLHKGHRERLRSKCVKNGLESLEPHEVLELLLFNAIPRRDTNPIAHKLLNKYGGKFSEVLEADIEELKTIDGIGDNAAFLLHLIPQLSRYYESSKWEEGVSLGTPQQLCSFAIDLCKGKTQEELVVICLDSNKHLKKYGVVSKGSINEVDIKVRNIAEYAIKAKAVNIVLVHNHPNNSAVPSKVDRESTIEVVTALGALSLNVIDHIVVSGNKCHSMKEMGFFNQ